MTTMAASALISPLALRGSTNLHTEVKQNARSLIIRCSKLRGAPELSSVEGPRLNQLKRRDVFGLLLGVSCVTLNFEETKAAGLPPEEKPKLCDDVCEKELENVGLLVALCCCFLSIKKLQIEVPMVTTESGLQYKDIKVAANYVAMVPSGQIFDSSLEKNQLYIFRVGSGQVIKGLDEGLLSMKAGGKRRLYIPGPLAFPKGLTSAPGRPRVAPNSPVVFDVSLEYIPGLESEEE